MKPINVVLIAVLFLIIGVVAASWYFRSKSAYFDLPEEGSTDYWGPYYWKAIHGIADRIPCSLCRHEGSELFSFVHDYVNFKTEKPIFDEANWNKWLNKFSEIRENRNMTNGR